MSPEQTALAPKHISGAINGVRHVCPSCSAELAECTDGVACDGCGTRYARLDTGIIDFAGAEVGFDDWWVQSPAKMQDWLTREAPKEEQFQSRFAQRYLLPLLARLAYPPGQATLLSAACGVGADVDLLNDAGYAAWGIDCGNRVMRWPERRYAERLTRADARNLPFPDNSFDMVTAVDLVEHVGVIGDTTAVAPDCQEQRLAAMRSLLRVTRPGGYVLLSSLNRRFPIDFGHLQHSRFLRFHSPWEPFLLSYGDVKQLCLATGEVDWVRPLPLRGFFSWTTLRQYPAVRPLLPVFDWALGSLPAWVYGSWLSFFWIALVHRREAGIAARSGS